ncbi:MAG: prolyl oligopeptidase family serine peptidase [Ignavibacteria bacterium]|jgi:dipeptidyl aminopeptidase/acylaminoacyl peptidase
MKHAFHNKKKYILFLSLLIIFISSVAAQNSKDQGKTEVIPFDLELAFSRKTFTYNEKQVVSPKGEYTAYCVFQQPKKSLWSRYPENARLLPNGVASIKYGSSIFIVNIKTGKERQISPKKSSSWQPSWSPDGNKLAFYSDTCGYPQLWLYDIRSGKKTRPNEIRIICQYWFGGEAKWSKDGKTVYVPIDLNWDPNLRRSTKNKSDSSEVTVKVLKTGEEREERKDSTYEWNEAFINMNNVTLASINIETGELDVIVKADELPRPSYLRLSASGKWLSYLSIYRFKDILIQQLYFDLVVLPSSGGDAKVIVSDLKVSSPSKLYYSKNYRWHPTEDKLVYFKDGELWVVDFTNGLESVPVQIGKDVENIQESPLLYTPDGTEIMIRMQGSDTLAFVSLNGKKTRLVSPGKEYSYRDVITTDDNTLWSPKKNCIAIQGSKGNKEGALIYLDTKSGSTEIVYTYGSNNSFITAIPEQESILVNMKDAYTPSNLYLLNTKTYKKEQLTEIDTRLRDVKFGNVEKFETEITRYDGERIKVNTAVLLPPGKKKGDKIPAVSIFYPGSYYSGLADQYAGGTPAGIPSAQLFATRGYAVILLDVPLSPKGGEPGNPIHDMTNAVLPQLYHAAELGYIDISRVGIIGQSYGGYSTASIITETNLFKAAVAFSGFYDPIAKYGHMNMAWTDKMFYFETGQGRMGTSPFSDLQRYIRNSPYLQAEKITTPLLLLHGENDSNCDVSEAKKMFIAMKRLGKTAQLAVYNGEGHVPFTWSLANGVDAMNRVFNFLDKYLTDN